MAVRVLATTIANAPLITPLDEQLCGQVFRKNGYFSSLWDRHRLESVASSRRADGTGKKRMPGVERYLAIKKRTQTQGDGKAAPGAYCQPLFSGKQRLPGFERITAASERFGRFQQLTIVAAQQTCRLRCTLEQHRAHQRDLFLRQALGRSR